jgi:hypothetical protein
MPGGGRKCLVGRVRMPGGGGARTLGGGVYAWWGARMPGGEGAYALEGGHACLFGRARTPRGRARLGGAYAWEGGAHA